ncbi:MAG: hypothetical protein IPG64_11175 [Haliea sp.]|nr:hypothetical protein [Haliea sp.]
MEDAGKRWALKSHSSGTQHIHREYPDALFAQTHRDRVKIVISTSNLAATLRGIASDRVDLHRSRAITRRRSRRAITTPWPTSSRA